MTWGLVSGKELAVKKEGVDLEYGAPCSPLGELSEDGGWEIVEQKWRWLVMSLEI